ncbi:MAG: SCO family protein [Planctomycetota bacterium]
MSSIDGENEKQSRDGTAESTRDHGDADAAAPQTAAANDTASSGGLRWPWLIGGMLCVIAAAVMVAVPFVLAAAPAPLDKYGPVPAFTLTDRFGEPFASDRLNGKVWVANFMFTTCPSICPVMSRHLGGLQAKLRAADLRNDAAIVSFSVQPEVDTPEVLREYGAAIQAEPGFWTLLTGERSDIWGLSKDGFKLHVGAVDNPVEPIAHTGKLVLVDQAGVIRGYYDGLTPAVIDELTRDVQRLVDAGP